MVQTPHADVTHVNTFDLREQSQWSRLDTTPPVDNQTNQPNAPFHQILNGFLIITQNLPVCFKGFALNAASF